MVCGLTAQGGGALGAHSLYGLREDGTDGWSFWAPEPAPTDGLL